jgi:pimeloyl-ACP methyl ester carboxylesterase
MAGDLYHLVHTGLGIDGPLSIVGLDLGSILAFGYPLRYRDDVVSLTTMEAPLPGTDYYEQRKVAKSAWHFDFHANPDIAVYLTHGRERWYITRFFDDLAYQPDAISQDDLDVYARAFEAPGAMRALCEIYRELDHDADPPSGARVEWSASRIRATCGAKSANVGFTYSAAGADHLLLAAQASG